MFEHLYRAAISLKNLPLNHRWNFKGKKKVNDLSDRIKIIRDDLHVPHIYAQNETDAFFGMGYVQAQDRLWQMELLRRTGSGTLAEVFGKAALDTDRFVRTVGLNRVADLDFKKLSEREFSLLESFVAGINTIIDKTTFATEFTLMRYKPSKWTVFDVLCSVRAMVWTMSHGWQGSLIRGKLVEHLQDEAMARELFPEYPADNPVAYPDGQVLNDLWTDSMFDAEKGPFLGRDMEGGGRGSNSWVLAPEHSESRNAMLVNDIHLRLTNPGQWYQCHISAGDLQVTGACIPGIPGIIVGHNAKIAWGITLAYTDCEDLFLEHCQVDAPDYFEYLGEFQPFEIFEEEIAVKGAGIHVEKVRQTVHGPVLPNINLKDSHVVTLQSKALEPSKLLEGILNLNYAENWHEFREACAQLSVLQLNITYADTMNNIGMQVTGEVPIRQNGKGLLPGVGWTGQNDWIADVSHNDLPVVLNPAGSPIIACNQKLVDSNYPFYLGNGFMNGYRAARIKSLLEEQPRQNFQSTRRIMRDVLSLPAAKFREWIWTDLSSSDPQINLVLNILKRWDLQMDSNSIGAACYAVFSRILLNQILEPSLSEKMRKTLMGSGEEALLFPTNEFMGHSHSIVLGILQNGDSKWVLDDNAIRLVQNALLLTHNELRELLGDETNWKWGALHRGSFRHAMGIKANLAKIFNIADFPMAGDSDTVAQSAYNPNSPYIANEFASSLRMIIDVSSWDNSRMVSAPGQSGVLGNANYKSQFERWFAGEDFAMHWSEEAVQKHKKWELILEPKQEKTR